MTHSPLKPRTWKGQLPDNSYLSDGQRYELTDADGIVASSASQSITLGQLFLSTLSFEHLPDLSKHRRRAQRCRERELLGYSRDTATRRAIMQDRRNLSKGYPCWHVYFIDFAICCKMLPAALF
jgi:hypothetical protein